MGGEKKMTLLRDIIAPPLLALLLLAGGSLAAQGVLQSRGGPKAKEILLQTGLEIRSANQILFEEKTYRILYDYSIAYLDSMIAFDFMPDYNLSGLIGILQHLPPDVEIQKIWFSYNSVSFQVSGSSVQQLVLFQEYLQNCEQYSTIFFYPDSASNDPFSGEFCCYL